MIIKDSFTLDAPVESTWAFLQDIPRVSACVPGAENVEQVEPDTYRGRLKVRVGPIKTAFGGTVSITERVPVERIAALVEGDDSTSSSRVKATFVATLAPANSGSRVDFEIDVALRGRLAQFGSTVFRATAKRMTAQFAACLQATLDETARIS